MRALSDRALVRIQSPFAASELSEPQPDVAVVPLGEYSKDHPSSAYLLIEVAETLEAVIIALQAERTGAEPGYVIREAVRRVVQLRQHLDSNQTG